MKKKHFRIITTISLLSLFIIVTSLAPSLDISDMYGKIPVISIISLVGFLILRNNIKLFLILQIYFLALFYTMLLS